LAAEDAEKSAEDAEKGVDVIAARMPRSQLDLA